MEAVKQQGYTAGPTDSVTFAGRYMPGQWVKGVNEPGQDGLHLTAFVPNEAFGGDVVKRAEYVALLAAAPELLAALRLVQAREKSGERLCLADQETIEAAIAKAEGR